MRAMKSLTFVVFFYLGLAGTVLAQQFPSPPGGQYQFVAQQTGDWDNPATWGESSLIPGDGDNVLIPETTTVTVERQETARHRFIGIEGQLEMATYADTRLFVETIYVAEGGAFEIGDVNNPVEAGVTAKVVFISDGQAIDLDWDPKQMSRGLVSDGTIRMFGQPKTHMIPMTADAFAGDDSLNLDEAASDWDEEDEIVVPLTTFERVTDPADPASSTLKLAIESIDGSQIDLLSSLDRDRVRPRSDLQLHIANLTRNVILRTEFPALLRDRGHVMFRDSDVDVRYVAFVRLGRTDKSTALDDLVVTKLASTYTISEPDLADVENRRGRYPVHFHKNGTQATAANPPSKVYGSVVVDTPGWGFVNHSSHVDFRENVCFDFVGAGFVTESGDELGNFFDNVAILGRGDGEYRQIKIVFKHPTRPQALSDFAFSGDGFWFQGPAIRARDNVASSCNGAGMMWFSTGAPDIQQLYTTAGGHVNNRYTHFPSDDVSDVYAGFPDLSSFDPRYWDHSVTDEKLVIADLPILELDGFVGYASFIGFRLRFNNHHSIAWYKEFPIFHYDDHIVGVCGTDNSCAVRMRQSLEDLELWNNEQGFRLRYSSLADWDHVDVVNRAAYFDPEDGDETVGHAGAELKNFVEDVTFSDLAIDGYPVAGWIEDGNRSARDEVDFSNPDPPAYASYANLDTWDPNQTCDPPSNVNSASGLGTAWVFWFASDDNERYLVRYKKESDQLWLFAATENTFTQLPDLESGVTYVFQVLSGCSEDDEETAVSTWTEEETFTTF